MQTYHHHYHYCFHIVDDSSAASYIKCYLSRSDIIDVYELLDYEVSL